MVGDSTDIVFRLKSALPKGWFSERSPNLTAILSCLAIPSVWLYNQLDYLKAQTRTSSATGAWLDLAAQDYLGNQCRRKPGENDAVYRLRIKKSLLAGAATRPALISGVSDLVGSTPVVFEPSNCQDTGAYGIISPRLFVQPCDLAYGVSGGWGSMQLPYQVFLTVKRPRTNGESGLAGYGTGPSGYGVGPAAYLGLSERLNYVTDKDIQARIRGLLPVNAVAWLRII